MSQNLELTLKVRGDSSDAKADIASLRQAYSTEINNIVRLVPGGGFLGSISNEVSRLTQSLQGNSESIQRVKDRLKGLEDQAGRVRDRFHDFNEALKINFGGQLDTNFLKQFRAAEDYAKRVELLQSKGFSSDHMAKVERAAFQFAKLERDGGAALSAIEKKSKDAATELANLQQSSGALAAFGGPAGIAVAALIAVGVAAVGVGVGVLRMTERVSEAAGKFWDLHQRANVNVETLSALDVALRRSGKSIEDAQFPLSTFQQTMGKVESGNKRAVATFDNLGITSKTLDGALNQAFASLSKMPEGVNQFNRAVDLFGKRGAPVMLGALKEAGGDFKKFQQDLKDSGFLIDSTTAQMADRFGDLEDKIKMCLEGAERQMASRFLPAMIVAFEGVDSVLEKNKGSWRTWGDVIADEISGLYALALAAKKTVDQQGVLAILSPAAAILGIIGNFDEAASEAAMARAKVMMDADAEVAKARKGGRDKASGSDESGADKAAQERIRQLEQQGKAVDREYKKQIDDAKRDLDQYNTSLEEGTERIIESEKKRASERIAILEQQRATAKKQSEKDKYANEIKSVEDERDKNIQSAQDNRNRKEVDALTAHQENLLAIIDNYAKRQADTYGRLAEIGAITFEEAERKILEVQTSAFNSRLDALIAEEREMLEKVGVQFDEFGQAVAGTGDFSKLNLEKFNAIGDRIAALQNRQAEAQEEAERKIDAGHDKDIEKERKFRESLQAIDEEYNQGKLNLEQQALNELVREAERHGDMSLGLQRYVIAERARLDMEEEDARHKRILADIDEQERSLKLLAKTAAKKLEIEREYNRLREQENDRHDKARERRQREGDEDSEDTTLIGTLRKLGEDIPKLSPEQFGLMALKDAFDQVKQAALESIDAFILYGDTAGLAFKKALVMFVADLSKEAFLQALREAALAASSFAAGDFGGAARHTAAALAWGAVSAGIAIGGRKIAGDSFKSQQSAAGGGSYSGGSSEQPQEQRFNYGGATFVSSTVAGEGSRNTGVFGRMAERIIESNERVVRSNYAVAQDVAALKQHIGSIPGGDLIRANPYAVGDSLQEAIQSSHGIRRDITSLGSTGVA
ncbi:MAG TPA: hypothetical protein VGB17_16450 [Pyrinomonadaceae bacterium]|jgi:hypothetical protein